MQNAIIVTAAINASLQKVWELWNDPAHITQWNAASPDWHTPRSENDLKPGGRFVHHMAAKDGSFSFDFGGIYDEVKPQKHTTFTIDDGRKVRVDFSADGDVTTVTESFEPEGMNPPEMQRAGWQAILDNFKRYAEAAK